MTFSGLENHAGQEDRQISFSQNVNGLRSRITITPAGMNHPEVGL
jgi:hypothetical protein